MSSVQKVLRLYRQGWTPSRIARDLRMPRTRVASILDEENSWEKLVDERGTTAVQILAALERHADDFEVANVEAVVELVLEIADQLDRIPPADPDVRRESVLHGLESVANSVTGGFTLESSSFIGIQLRRALRHLAHPDEADESSWPDWLRAE
jgi:hypothetical protein